MGSVGYRGTVGSEGDYVKGTTYAAMDSEQGGTVRSNGGSYTAPRMVPGGPSILP